MSEVVRIAPPPPAPAPDPFFYARAVRRYWAALLLGPALTAGAAALLWLALPHRYQAEGVLRVGSFDGSPLALGSEVQASLTSGAALEELLGGMRAKHGELAEVERVKLDASEDSGGRVARLFVTTQSRELSRELADALMRRVIAEHAAAFQSHVDVVHRWTESLVEQQQHLRTLMDDERARLAEAPLAERTQLASRIDEQQKSLDDLHDKELKALTDLEPPTALHTTIAAAAYAPARPTLTLPKAAVGGAGLGVLLGFAAVYVLAFLESEKRRASAA